MSRSGNIEGIFLLFQGNENVFYKPRWVFCGHGGSLGWSQGFSRLLSQIRTGLSNFINVIFRQKYLNSSNFNQGYSKQRF